MTGVTRHRAGPQGTSTYSSEKTTVKSTVRSPGGGVSTGVGFADESVSGQGFASPGVIAPSVRGNVFTVLLAGRDRPRSMERFRIYLSKDEFCSKFREISCITRNGFPLEDRVGPVGPNDVTTRFLMTRHGEPVRRGGPSEEGV